MGRHSIGAWYVVEVSDTYHADGLKDLYDYLQDHRMPCKSRYILYENSWGGKTTIENLVYARQSKGHVKLLGRDATIGGLR